MPKVDDWEDWAFAKVLVAIFICERKKGARQMASALTLQVSDLVKLLLNGFECFGLSLDAALSCQALDGSCAEEAIDTRNVFDDVSRILGLGDGATMADNECIGVDVLLSSGCR